MSKLNVEFVCARCGKTVGPGEPCRCKPTHSSHSTILESNDILYLCDRRACHGGCSPECKHTQDITHAVNFEIAPFGKGAFIEKEKV